MKKIYVLLLACFGLNLSTTLATTHTIDISGVTYSPSALNAVVGDEVVIMASGSHPLVEVNQTTWDANGNTAMSGGFGTHTSTFTFTLTEVGVIYYVCSNHVSMGMKGMITVDINTDISSQNITALQLFPNPVVDGTFNLKGEKELLEESVLELYSVNGQLVHSFEITDASMTLNVQVAAGTYTAVLVKNEKAIFRQRLMVNSKQ
jgi:plastocyanin